MNNRKVITKRVRARKIKGDLVIKIMTAVIIILLLIIIYGFIVQPQVQSSLQKKQLEAYNQGVKDTITMMLQQIKNQGYTQIFSGEESLTLVPYQEPAQ